MTVLHAATSAEALHVVQILLRPPYRDQLHVNAQIAFSFKAVKFGLTVSMREGGTTPEIEPDPSVFHTVWGRSALHTSARQGWLDIVKILLEDHRINVALLDSQGMTALHKAAKYGRLSVVKALIEDGKMDPGVSSGTDNLATVFDDLSGFTALHLASLYGKEETVSYLIGLRADLCNIRDAHGWTPLARAASGGHASIVETFLQQPAIHVNIMDTMHGYYIIPEALLSGDLKTFELLWQYPNINRDVRSLNNITLAMLAERWGRLEALEYIRAYERSMQDKSVPSGELASAAEINTYTPSDVDLDRPLTLAREVSTLDNSNQSVPTNEGTTEPPFSPRRPQEIPPRASTPIAELYRDDEREEVIVKSTAELTLDCKEDSDPKSPQL